MRIDVDCAINLAYSKLLMEGKLPYVDFVDTNPPLIMYICTIPVAIAQSLHLHVILVWSVLVTTHLRMVKVLVRGGRVGRRGRGRGR
jgi:hypothetical protein